jgi:hypothetical protein
MLKTFTLNNRVDEQLSDTAGTIVFSVTDENNVERKIFADTFLDENHVPQGVTASNKRELPLVEGLFRMDIGETTSIDFTLFNKTFKRDVNKTPNQVAHDEVLKMEKEGNSLLNSLRGKAGKLFKSKKEKKTEAVAS